MLEVFLFYENRILKGVFFDKNIMKEKIFHYIISFHTDKNLYENKLEAGRKLKQKFGNLFKENFYFLESKNNVWSIIKTDVNKIETITMESYKTFHTNINVKGHKCNKKDLYHDLAYLPLTELYDKI